MSGPTGISVTAPSLAPVSALLPPSSGSATVGAASSPVSGGSSARTPFFSGVFGSGGGFSPADTPEPSAWVSLTLGGFGLAMLAARRRRVRA